ncbi:hypothetical protein HBB16_08050 [Pseudonocardia sp. MCCB 268]|nr:hypothetical protein [Pseudonocardia cytotoxica]
MLCGDAAGGAPAVRAGRVPPAVDAGAAGRGLAVRTVVDCLVESAPVTTDGSAVRPGDGGAAEGRVRHVVSVLAVVRTGGVVRTGDVGCIVRVVRHRSGDGGRTAVERAGAAAAHGARGRARSPRRLVAEPGADDAGVRTGAGRARRRPRAGRADLGSAAPGGAGGGSRPRPPGDRFAAACSAGTRGQRVATDLAAVARRRDLAVADAERAERLHALRNAVRPVADEAGHVVPPARDLLRVRASRDPQRCRELRSWWPAPRRARQRRDTDRRGVGCGGRRRRKRPAHGPDLGFVRPAAPRDGRRRHRRAAEPA